MACSSPMFNLSTRFPTVICPVPWDWKWEMKKDEAHDSPGPREHIGCSPNGIMPRKGGISTPVTLLALFPLLMSLCALTLSYIKTKSCVFKSEKMWNIPIVFANFNQHKRGPQTIWHGELVPIFEIWKSLFKINISWICTL